MNTEDCRDLHLRGALGLVRSEKWDGRDHLVIPVIALREGVIHAVNAPVPEFVPEDVLIRSYSQWNGLPLVVNHPTRNGSQVSASTDDVRKTHAFGIIRNAEVRGKRLTMEVLVDPARLELLGENQLLADLRAGEMVEVSVGVYAHTVAAEGEADGRRYKAKWTEIRPDHLAFLPGGTGACSLKMGCGAHRHATTYLVTAEAFEPVTLDLPTLTFTTLEGQSLDERIEAVNKAVQKKWGVAMGGLLPDTVVYAYAQPIFDDHAIVHVNEKVMSVKYTLDGDGNVVFGEELEVKQAWVAAKSTYKECEACKGTGSLNGNPCETCDGNGELKAAAGARHSTKDMEMIQAVHDHATSLGATCERKNLKTAVAPTRAIKHEGGHWVLYSADGSRWLGVHDTEAEAVAHRDAIDEYARQQTARQAVN